MRLPFLLLLAAYAILMVAAGEVRAQPAPDSEEELLLLVLRVDSPRVGRIPGGDLEAYDRRGRVLLPLGMLASQLELGLTVDPEAGRVEGRVLRGGPDFRFRAATGQVEIDGQTFPIDPDAVMTGAGDIWVDLAILEEWLPVDLALDRGALLLVARPRQILPLEERRLRAESSGPRVEDRRVEGERQDDPYAMLATPFIDLSLRLSSVPQPPEGRTTRLAHSVASSGDFLGLSSYLDLRGSLDDPLSSAWVRLGRADPDGGLFGPLGLREIQLGHVQAPELDQIALPGFGPGIRLGSFPLDLPDRFDGHTFHGPLLPGWEVELYRNDALVGYVAEATDEAYAFPDVPLLFGRNEFRLQFYGPGGERRQESRTFRVGRTLVRPGAVHYRAVAQRGTDDRRRGTFEVLAGLPGRMSLNVAVAALTGGDDEAIYAQARIQGAAGRWLGQLSGATRDDGGAVLEAGVDTHLGPLALAVRHATLADYRSEIYESVHGPLESRSTVRLNGIVSLGWGLSMPFVVEGRRDGIDGMRDVRSLHARASVARQGMWLTSELDWFDRGGVDGARAVGTTLVHRAIGRTVLRGEAVYDLAPERMLTDLAITFESPLPNGLRLSVGVQRRLADDEDRLTLRLGKTLGAFGFSTGAERSSSSGTSTSGELNVGLSRDPRSGAWRTGARSATRSGAVAARVFLDRDGDGRPGPGEERLAGVGVRIGGAMGPRTDASGEAFIADLTPDRPVVLQLEPGTIEDPLWVPSVPGIEVVPRAGKVTTVDLPVRPTGEIIGTVTELVDGARRPLPGIELELVDARGAVVARTRTAYDGFYDLPRIPPGRYVLRAGPRSVGTAYAEAHRTIEIGLEGSILDGVDLALSPVESVARAR